MHYEILDTDVGQGAGAVAVPVTYGKTVERTDICQPYSVAEVLQNVFHADFQTVLENYVRTETEQIQEAGVLPGAEGMKVRLWSYLKTLSKLQQPTDRTVVDVILQSRLEGQYKNGETRYESADFRLRYIFDLRVCHQCCIGPLVWVYKDWEDDPALSGFAFDTNDYLLPILYNSDYETVAHAILGSIIFQLNEKWNNAGVCMALGSVQEKMTHHHGLSKTTRATKNNARGDI